MNPSDPIQALKSTGTWQWQSNAQPWSSEEIEWKPYSQKINELLEKAYSKGVKEGDLKDGYVVNLTDMLQINKNNEQQQRRIRRIEADYENNIIANSRKERYFGVEIPKRTYVSPFGTIQDYLNFFQNRDPHIQEFTTNFAQIEQNADIDALNSKIVPLIVAAIEKEVEFLLIENKGKAKDIQSDRKELVEMFSNKKFNSFVEFYGCILKAYTLHSFLFSSLNSFLREEDWPRLENLLPYAFCLGKTFLHPSFTGGNVFEELKKSVIEQGHPAQDFIELYRGATLSEELLKFYDIKKTKYFSWNGVTSTTIKHDNAEFFGEKKGDNNILVLFIIQVPLTSNNQATQNLIYIKQYSFYPEEEEVILAPGSIFELAKFEQKPERAEITIRLIRNISQLRHQGILMQGVFNSEIGKMGKDFLMTHLRGQELEEAITHLKGNRLIERLEINSCIFTQRSLKLLHQTLQTLENLKGLKLFANSSEDLSYAISAGEISKLKIESLEVYDQSCRDELVVSLNKSINNMRWLKRLSLSFENSKLNSEKLDILFQGLQTHQTLENLYLNFESVDFQDDYSGDKLSYIHGLGEGLKSFPLLKSLDIDFSWTQLDDVCMRSLFDGIKTLSLLKSLKIDTIDSRHLTSQSLYFISESLFSLEKLESLKLTLHFEKLRTQGNNEDKGYYYLGQGIANLSALTTLELNFDSSKGARQDRDKRVLHVEAFPLFAGVFALKGLRELCLNFPEISSDKLTQVAFEGIATLPLLTRLDVSFFESEKLTKDAFNSFATGIQTLKSLTSLTLNFQNTNIPDEGVKLVSDGIETLDTLTTLNLTFWDCKKITDDGFTALSKALRPLQTLTELELNFYKCHISDVGLCDVAMEIGENLRSLASLNLCLQGCSDITDQGLKILSQQIGSLSSLLTLELDISNNKKITDIGLSFLSQELKVLKNLKFSLDARKTKEVTKEGLQNFSKEMKGHIQSVAVFRGNRLQGKGQRLNYERKTKNLEGDVLIQNLNEELEMIIAEESEVNETINKKGHLKRLSQEDFVELQKHYPISCLSLIFEIFPKGEGKTLSKALMPLYGLKILKLDFSSDLAIDDAAVISLADGIKGLNTLKQLVIDLTRTQVRDKGVKVLFEAIGKLNSLLKLKVDFAPCNMLEGARNLFNFGQMNSRNSLLSLNLSFFGCSSLSDESVKHLFGDLKMLTSLREFRLRFGESDLTNASLQHLSAQLREMRSLTRLKLKMIGIDDIGDEGCEYITQAIKQLTGLQVLELNLSWTGLTDEGLVHFSKGMRSLGALRKIDFRFQGCEAVSEAREESLVDLLRYLGFKQL